MKPSKKVIIPLKKSPLVQVSNTPDVETFKSFFYLLNGKTDSDIRILEDDKIIAYSDLLELNQKVIAKLSTETTKALMVKVVIEFANHHVYSFEYWDEFLKCDRSISYKVKTINVSWDFLLSLPGYKIPQRHTLKVRMGSQIKPSEFFQILMSSDEDHKIHEAIANVIAKVDFISPVISSELLNIVEEWHKGLPSNRPKNRLQQFLEKYPQELSHLIETIYLIGSVILIYLILNKFIFADNIQKIEMGVNNVMLYGVVAAVFYLTSRYVGKLLASKIFQTLKSLNDYPVFNITKGDKNKVDEIKIKNVSLLREVFIQVLVGFIFIILSGIVHFFF